MKRIIGVLSFCAIINAMSREGFPRERLQSLVDEVNAKNTTWTAGNNFDNVESCLVDKRFMFGALPPDNRKPRNGYSTSGTGKCPNVPSNFDARKEWKRCNATLNHVYNQGNCGSCWAVSVASAFTDRLCIKTNGTVLRSVQQILSCAGPKLNCTVNCGGGDAWAAWKYLKEEGLTTGGDYQSNMVCLVEGCQPYTIKSCSERNHALKSSSQKHVITAKPWSENENDIEEDSAKTPICKNRCYNKDYKINFTDDKVKARKIYVIEDDCHAQKEIFTKGPIVASFQLFEDFNVYQSGVYQHVIGENLSWHAVRVIGYGIEKDVPYWLAVNSYGEGWGDKGTFKILRGTKNGDARFGNPFTAGEV